MVNYVMSIVFAAIICAAIRILYPAKGAIGQIIKVLSGILLLTTIITPLRDISFHNLTDYLDNLTSEADMYVEEGRANSQEKIDVIIKSESEAYILDKASQMDLQISVEVSLDEDNHSIPCGITIIGSISPYSKEILSGYIADTLGIAKEKQIWISKG